MQNQNMTNFASVDIFCLSGPMTFQKGGDKN